MPWIERLTVSLRKELVLKVLAREVTVAEVCREFGVSRKTAYKWIARFRDQGLAGLVDESRRPDASPLQVSSETTLDVIELRRVHPTWGPKKLQALLAKRLAGDKLPSARSVARILERSSLTVRRRYRPLSKGLSMGAPRLDVSAPNDAWTVDFKGWWQTEDGARCEPLTIRDAHSRMVLALQILKHTQTKEVRDVFVELFTKYGIPRAILSDNGSPFASVRALGGLTKLSAWWVACGIDVVRSRPGCPQDNGAHERMHADVRREIQSKGASTLVQQQAICDDWRAEFNHVRPHEALGMKTPAEVYGPTATVLTTIMTSGFVVNGALAVVVNRGGIAKYEDKRVYVSTALAGYSVGVRRIDSARAEVWFFRRLLGEIRMNPLERDISVEAVTRPLVT